MNEVTELIMKYKLKDEVITFRNNVGDISETFKHKICFGSFSIFFYVYLNKNRTEAILK